MSSIILHSDYDKIVDVIWTSGILRFTFNIVLNRKDHNTDKRISYHQEYYYRSNKYSDVSYMRTIRRQFDYYATIEFGRTEGSDKQVVLIRNYDLRYIKESFSQVDSWFKSSKYSNLFYRDSNDKLQLSNYDLKIIISGLPMNKTLTLKPIVISYEDNTIEGVRFILDDSVSSVDVSYRMFEGFLVELNLLNMYQSAQLLLNYIGRPEFGTNSLSFEESKKDNINGFAIIPDREIPKKNKSVFDKLDSL